MFLVWARTVFAQSCGEPARPASPGGADEAGVSAVGEGMEDEQLGGPALWPAGAEPGGAHPGVVDDEEVTAAQERRQLAEAAVLRRPLRREVEQQRGVAPPISEADSAVANLTPSLVPGVRAATGPTTSR